MSWWYPLVGAVLFVFLIRFWMRRRSRKQIAPFEVAPDDPLLKEAVAKAREKFDQMRELFAQRPRDTYVKISHVSEDGRTEHLWGRLLELTERTMKFEPENLHPAYQGPLAGVLERPLADLEDWQVELPDGKIRGGYTLKVMFLRAKEQCENFPPDLAEQQERYVDH